MLSCNAGLMSLVVEKYAFPVVWHDGISHFRDFAKANSVEPGIKVISMSYHASSHAFDVNGL